MDKPIKVFLNVMVDGYVKVDVATTKREYQLAYRRNYNARNREMILEKARKKVWTCPNCQITIQTRNTEQHIELFHTKKGIQDVYDHYVKKVNRGSTGEPMSYDDYYKYRVENLKYNLANNISFCRRDNYQCAPQPNPLSSSCSP
jgi:hypothetical protein